MSRVYLLFDGRAITGSTEGVAVLVRCESNAEAESYRGEFEAMACYSYRATSDGGLDNEHYEWSFTPR